MSIFSAADSPAETSASSGSDGASKPRRARTAPACSSSLPESPTTFFDLADGDEGPYAFEQRKGQAEVVTEALEAVRRRDEKAKVVA